MIDTSKPPSAKPDEQGATRAIKLLTCGDIITHVSNLFSRRAEFFLVTCVRGLRVGSLSAEFPCHCEQCEATRGVSPTKEETGWIERLSD